MSMKKFKDKKKRLRRQIKHEISVPKIFIYNKLKEKLNWTPSRKDFAFPPRGINSPMITSQNIKNGGYLARAQVA